MTDEPDRPYCRRCASPYVVACVVAATGEPMPVCHSCYWKREGVYVVATVRAGLNANLDRCWPPIPEHVPVGIMQFVAPAAAWPPGFALMKCPVVRCGLEQVGPLHGWPCEACVDRGRRAV